MQNKVFKNKISAKQSGRVAVVNDLSSFGKCSLTASLPIFSCMGLQACPLPTAVLSCQTGFENFFQQNEKRPAYLHELQISEHCLFAFILQSEFVAAAFDKQLLDRHQLFHIHRLQD